MKFSAEELNIIRQADAIIAGKITTTDFITAPTPRVPYCGFVLLQNHANHSARSFLTATTA